MYQYLRFFKCLSCKDQSVYPSLYRERPSDPDKYIGSQGSIFDAISSIKTQTITNKYFKIYLEKTLFSICEYLLVRNRYVYIEGTKILEKNIYQNLDCENKKSIKYELKSLVNIIVNEKEGVIFDGSDDMFEQAIKILAKMIKAFATNSSATTLSRQDQETLNYLYPTEGIALQPEAVVAQRMEDASLYIPEGGIVGCQAT